MERKHTFLLKYINILAFLLTCSTLLCSCTFLAPQSLEPFDEGPSDTQSQETLIESEAEIEKNEKPTEEHTEGGVGEEICEHEFGEWVIVTEPECLGANEGLRKCECKLCGTVKRETLYCEGHVDIVTDAAKEATCKEEGLTEGKHCRACGTVISAQSVIPLRSHTYSDESDKDCNVCGFERDVECKHLNTDVIPEKKPNCTQTGLTEGEVCSDCGHIIKEQSVIDALGHTEKVIKGYAPTETKDGLTDGKHCSVCKTVLLSQRPILATSYGDIERYATDYAYKSFADFDNGKAMQELYVKMDEVAKSFHNDTEKDIKKGTNGKYLISSVDFSELGLTSDEALSVWSMFRNDHPMYYWLPGVVTYNSSVINLLTAEEYANGADRAEYNKLVVDSVRRYVSYIEGETSPYRIALGLHDAIINDVEYAYKSDGRTPEDAVWAHNVIGIFENGSGVCEGYAKVFQLILNYCKVENVYVTGVSQGVDHAWNMAKMDDGNWYWFDLTWDDKSEWMLGATYNYFCVTDREDVSWIDGPWASDAKTFSSTHTYFLPTDFSVNKQYVLPSRAGSPIDLEIEMLRDVFEVDGFSYAVIGYNTVQLVGTSLTGAVTVPDSVIYDDVEYSVRAIGAIDGKLVKTDPIATEGVVSEIFLPESIDLIWDQALMLSGLEKILVDEENDVYEAVDGVLFTESLYTLIQYPIGNKAIEYSIPDTTVEIANFSFGKGDIGTLRALNFGASVKLVGTMNAGYGYRDSSDGGELNIASGDFFYINGFMDFEGSITLSEDNIHFTVENGAFYNADKTVLHFLANRSVSSFECPNGVTVIDVGAFFSCSILNSINLPETVEEIRTYAIGYCTFMRTLNFDGTAAKWESIQKHNNWVYNTPSFRIVCGQ